MQTFTRGVSHGPATVHRVETIGQKTDLDLNAGFVPQQWAWNRSSRKNSLLASRRKPRRSSACCWRRLPSWRRNFEELERQVKGKTPQNSSLPPSTQHPHAKPQPPKRKSKKKRGGQPGHEKHERPLIPTEDCDDVQPLKPTECRRCGEKLSGSDPGAAAASGVGIARDQAAW